MPARGHGDKLTHKQDQAIIALLSQSSIPDAAQACGLSPVTLHRWLKDTGFQAAYREARRHVVQQAITQVQQATGEAVETLRAVMQDPEAPASAKVSAAKTILETAVKAVELEDVEQRLAALEAREAR
jgi:DNA-binding MurR/RpiR family transcriptional regulator